MPRVESDLPLLPSILDRLIDDEPDVSTEPAWHRAQSVREFEQAVLRDVEALLNTRAARRSSDSGLSEVGQSVLTYGMPDFSSAGAGSDDDQQKLCRAVEVAIGRFEPRIRNVTVRVNSGRDQQGRKLWMVIEGDLWIYPEPQRITFDTVVEPHSGQFELPQK